jgi:hypothetical protein
MKGAARRFAGIQQHFTLRDVNKEISTKTATDRSIRFPTKK